MKLKSLFVATMVLAASMFLSGTAMAYTFTVGTSYGPYQTGNGGEFTLTPGDGLGSVLKYDGKAMIGIAIESFCLEHGEFINTGRTYNVILHDAAVHGGVGGTKTTSTFGGLEDKLSKGAAWLYYEFSKGTLEGYNYTVDRKSTAAALQNTIWWLEGELNSTSTPNTLAAPDYSNIFTKLVLNHFGGLTQAAIDMAVSDNNNYRPVQVATMWNIDGSVGQDMIVTTGTVPIPPAIYLLGAGLMGIGAVRKRVNKI
jgi:hypothetical protein